MDANIKSTVLEVSSEIFSGESVVSAENDLIVPDNMPDILSILQISANCAISACDAQNDRILLTGNVFFNILYLADTPRREVKAINTKAVFSNIFSAPGVNENLPVTSKAVVSSVSFKLANCRKLAVHADVLGSVSVSGNSQLSIPTDIEGAEMLTSPLTCSVIKARGVAQETVTDSFELPASKVPITEILRDEVRLSDKAVKVIHNKAIVKGSVTVTVLYSSEAGIEQAKTDIPFTKVVNVEGLEDSMDVDCTIDIQGWETALGADENGEQRVIDVETMLYFSVTGRETATCSAITDAYLPGGRLSCDRSGLSLATPPISEVEECAVKGSVRLPSDQGDIESVLDIKGCPRIIRVSREESELVIEGAVTVSLLFRTNNPEAPIGSLSSDVDFRHTLSGEKFAILPTAEADLKHMNCSIGSGNTIEIRGLATVTLTSSAPLERSVITAVRAEEEEKREAPSILISYIAGDRSLWDIAKKYNISRAKLMAANDISSEDELKSKKALVIPR